MQKVYAMLDNFRGNDFFDPTKFSFFTGNDPTNGYVDYVSKVDAEAANLIGVDTNGRASIRVDSNSIPPTTARGRKVMKKKNLRSSVVVVVVVRSGPSLMLTH